MRFWALRYAAAAAYAPPQGYIAVGSIRPVRAAIPAGIRRAFFRAIPRHVASLGGNRRELNFIQPHETIFNFIVNYSKKIQKVKLFLFRGRYVVEIATDLRHKTRTVGA